MQYLIFIAFLAIPVQSRVFKSLPKTIRSDKIVKLINDNPNCTWKADNYGFHEIDVEQFARTRLGVKFSNELRSSSKIKNSRKSSQAKPVSATAAIKDTLPESFTWTDEKNTKCVIDYINDQSNCGSCWAFASVKALQDRFCIQTEGRIKVELSPGYVMSCNTENDGCSGGYMTEVYDFFVNEGVITGGDYNSDVGCQPYTIRPCGSLKSSKMPCTQSLALTPRCRGKKCTNDWYRYKSEPDKNVFKASKYKYINGKESESDEYRIRKEIYENGPVTAAFLVLDDFPFYTEGIYDPNGYYILGGHAVRVVGWGAENGVKYWLVANSWGRDWGEKGFFRIIRGTNAVWFEDYVMSAEPHLTNNHTFLH